MKLIYGNQTFELVRTRLSKQEQAQREIAKIGSDSVGKFIFPWFIGYICGFVVCWALHWFGLW
jgi:hypothetical protein